MAAHVGGGVWFGDEWGLEERSRKPSIPSARSGPIFQVWIGKSLDLREGRCRFMSGLANAP